MQRFSSPERPTSPPARTAPPARATASSTSSCRSRTPPRKTCSRPPGRPATSARSSSPPRQRKVKLASEPEVDAEIDLNQAGSAFFLSARLNVHVPGVEREVAQELIEAAHGICPYSKAVHGNIDVTTTLV
ncbi:putative membrane protein [Bradyrhizobium sp. USDA 4512]